MNNRFFKRSLISLNISSKNKKGSLIYRESLSFRKKMSSRRLFLRPSYNGSIKCADIFLLYRQVVDKCIIKSWKIVISSEIDSTFHITRSL